MVTTSDMFKHLKVGAEGGQRLIDLMRKEKPMEKIKPCPFCGGKGFAIHVYGYWTIVCSPKNNCMVKSKTLFYEKKSDAIAAWNMRKGESE